MATIDSKGLNTNTNLTNFNSTTITSSSETGKIMSDLSIKIQKKLVGRAMTNKDTVKHFIDENSARLLDNLNVLSKMFYEEAKVNGWPTMATTTTTSGDGGSVRSDPDKVVKHSLKIIAKIGILMVNKKFSTTELTAAQQVQNKIIDLLSTVAYFHETDYSYDRSYLIKMGNQIRTELKCLIKPHLTDRSLARVDVVCDLLTNEHFLDRLFRDKLTSSTSDINDPLMEDLSTLNNNNPNSNSNSTSAKNKVSQQLKKLSFKKKKMSSQKVSPVTSDNNGTINDDPFYQIRCNIVHDINCVLEILKTSSSSSSSSSSHKN